MTREIEQVEAIQNDNSNNLYKVVAFKHDFPENTPNDEIEKTVKEKFKEELLKQENLTDKERENIKNINTDAIKVNIIKDLDSKTDISFDEENKMIITDHNGTEVFSENVYIAVLARFLFELDDYTHNRMKKDREKREEEFREFVENINEYQNDPNKRDDNKAFSKLFLDYIGTFAGSQDDPGYLVKDYKDFLAGGAGEEFDIKNFMKDKRFNWYLMPLLIVKEEYFNEYLDHYVKRKEKEGVEIELNQEHRKKMSEDFIRNLSPEDKINNINILRGRMKGVSEDAAKKISKWFKEDVKNPCDQCLKTTAVDLQKVKVTIKNKEWPLIAYLSGSLDETTRIEGKNGANQVVNFTNNEESIISTNVEKFGLPDRLTIGVNSNFYVFRCNNIETIDEFIVKTDTFIDKYQNFFKSSNNNVNKNIDEIEENSSVELKDKYSIKKYEMSTVKDAKQSIDALYAFYEGFIYDGRTNVDFCYFGDSPEDYNFMLKLGVRIIEENVNKLKKLENKLKEIEDILKSKKESEDILVESEQQDDFLKQQKLLLLKEGRLLLEEGKNLLEIKKGFLKKRLSGLKVVIKYNPNVQGKDKTLEQLFNSNFDYVTKINATVIQDTEKLIKANEYSDIINARESLEGMLEIQAISKDGKVTKYDIGNYRENKKRTSGQIITRC